MHMANLYLDRSVIDPFFSHCLDAAALNGSQFGVWNDPVFYDSIACSGDEQYITECISTEVGDSTNTGCIYPTQRAAVRCTEGESLMSTRLPLSSLYHSPLTCYSPHLIIQYPDLAITKAQSQQAMIGTFQTVTVLLDTWPE